MDYHQQIIEIFQRIKLLSIENESILQRIKAQLQQGWSIQTYDFNINQLTTAKINDSIIDNSAQQVLIDISQGVLTGLINSQQQEELNAKLDQATSFKNQIFQQILALVPEVYKRRPPAPNLTPSPTHTNFRDIFIGVITAISVTVISSAILHRINK